MSSRALNLVLLGAAAIATFLGWRAFWFLTDDALIAFRYASQSLEGFGYVWNRPPFEPVEGYTSFLWVFVLRHLWAWTGWPPTETANWIALGFGLLSLVLLARMVERMALPTGSERVRSWLLAGVLVGTVGNRTFLTWLSSGLETSLFNFLVTAWLYRAFFPSPAGSARGLLQLSLCAAAAALTRPDGLLWVAATLLLALLHWREGRALPRAAELGALLPLLVVPAHLFWRYGFYGQWLPNTYYAKYVAPWPAAGLRYLACFVLEYGVWVWLLLLAAHVAARRQLPVTPARIAPGAGVVAIGLVIGHLGFYTLNVGGDHFEYRVYSYTIPLLFASGAWLAAWSLGPRRARLAPVLLGLFVLASLPIPWIHWQQTRAEPRPAFVPVAPHAPAALDPLLSRFDSMQQWLILRLVGVRQHTHRQFLARQRHSYPTRAEGRRIAWDEAPPSAALRRSALRAGRAELAQLEPVVVRQGQVRRLGLDTLVEGQ